MAHPDRCLPLQFDKFGRISSIWLARRVRTVQSFICCVHLLAVSCLLACVACRTALLLCCAFAPQSRAELFAPPSASPLAMVRTRC